MGVRKIDADFNHTTLWVSKTKANVTSLTNDYITYNSNATTVEFGCDNKYTQKTSSLAPNVVKTLMAMTVSSFA